ncbi:hypothetical protein CGMCC3_g17639 [Colletotrichum fructicola]|nr:uncharacterized protein CGMCC3_g17639 [Colletotrichum fructicola]KAE9566206.1 hypothetical protein CGMCC3_g17639 [Colletotrichum fructicola]
MNEPKVKLCTLDPSFLVECFHAVSRFELDTYLPTVLTRWPSGKRTCSLLLPPKCSARSSIGPFGTSLA